MKRKISVVVFRALRRVVPAIALYLIASVVADVAIASPNDAQPPGATPLATNGAIHGSITSLPAVAARSSVIWLENAPIAHPASPTVRNVKMEFIPYVSVVTVGSAVTFTNEDPFPHNVFSPDNERWDIGTLQQNESRSRTFSRVGAYAVLCNLHPNMKGYVVVVPSSYFAQTDAQGNYAIKDVPPGTYRIVAWGPGVQQSGQSVTVNGDVTVNFNLHR